MNKYLGLITLVLILSSCTDAPSNGRADNDNGASPGDRTPQTPCSGSDCAITASETILPSMIYRAKGAERYTLEQVQKYLKADNLPQTHHIPANPDTDNDEQIKQYKPDLKDCGQLEKFNGVPARIKSCENANKASATWDAKANGISGEANWKLVMHDKKNDITLWLDARTNLIWSYAINADTWNMANGSAGTKSLCEDLNDVTFKQVKWYLPNRNEFLQADIDGARFVLADTQYTYWTATTGLDPKQAWAIEQSTGALKLFDKQETRKDIRCVGVPIK